MEEVIIRDITPTPSFLQPPGQELSPTENTAKAAAVLSKMNIQPEESKKDKNRPAVSSTPVPGTPWCVGYSRSRGRVFFFNLNNKESVWEKPAELVGRSDVDKMLSPVPVTANKVKKKQQAKVRIILFGLSLMCRLSLFLRKIRKPSFQILSSPSPNPAPPQPSQPRSQSVPRGLGLTVKSNGPPPTNTPCTHNF